MNDKTNSIIYKFDEIDKEEKNNFDQFQSFISKMQNEIDALRKENEFRKKQFDRIKESEKKYWITKE